MKFLAFLIIAAAQLNRPAYCQEKPAPAQSQDKSTQTASGHGSNAEKAPDVQTPIDYDYAWDEFYHRSRLIWECRGVQSGNFVPPEFCAFKEKVDTQWPDKKIPGHWKPQ